MPLMPATAEEIPPPLPTLRSRLGAAIAALLLILTGCDPTVDSFQENDLHYSLFGVLNASADSQFVRVEPLRDGLLDRAPETLNAEVTLTNLSTDRTVPLRDSLFRYLDQATAHNFYTTVPLDSGTTYRLRVRGPAGAESHADAVIPDSEPVLSIVSPFKGFKGLECDDPYRWNPTVTVAIRGVERVVSVRAIYDLDSMSSFGYLADTLHTEPGIVEVRIEYVDDLCALPNTREPDSIKVMVAAGTPEWPEFLRLNRETELLPGVASNVEGGVGFVGGIATDTITVYPYFED